MGLRFLNLRVGLLVGLFVTVLHKVFLDFGRILVIPGVSREHIFCVKQISWKIIALENIVQPGVLYQTVLLAVSNGILDVGPGIT